MISSTLLCWQACTAAESIVTSMQCNATTIMTEVYVSRVLQKYHAENACGA